MSVADLQLLSRISGRGLWCFCTINPDNIKEKGAYLIMLMKLLILCRVSFFFIYYYHSSNQNSLKWAQSLYYPYRCGFVQFQFPCTTSQNFVHAFP